MKSLHPTAFWNVTETRRRKTGECASRMPVWLRCKSTFYPRRRERERNAGGNSSSYDSLGNERRRGGIRPAIKGDNSHECQLYSTLSSSQCPFNLQGMRERFPAYFKLGVQWWKQLKHPSSLPQSIISNEYPHAAVLHGGSVGSKIEYRWGRSVDRGEEDANGDAAEGVRREVSWHS